MATVPTLANLKTAKEVTLNTNRINAYDIGKMCAGHGKFTPAMMHRKYPAISTATFTTLKTNLTA